MLYGAPDAVPRTFVSVGARTVPISRWMKAAVNPEMWLFLPL
jgi:hypothetical protein